MKQLSQITLIITFFKAQIVNPKPNAICRSFGSPILKTTGSQLLCIGVVVYPTPVAAYKEFLLEFSDFLSCLVVSTDLYILRSSMCRRRMWKFHI